MKKDIRFKFMGLGNQNENQVDIEIDSNGNITVTASTNGYCASGGRYGGRFMAGCSIYKFPKNLEFKYENLKRFIEIATWIGKDFGKCITEEEFNNIVN